MLEDIDPTCARSGGKRARNAPKAEIKEEEAA